LRQTPNLEGQAPVFISPSDRVAQIYAQAPGYFFVAFYDSQGYGGGILTSLHTGDLGIRVHASTILLPNQRDRSGGRFL
jgi:hypothetical protein